MRNGGDWMRDESREGDQRERGLSTRFRTLVERLLLVLIGLLFWRTWFIEGLFTRLRVTSGSMAHALVGLHREPVCDVCGWRFDCASDVRSIRSRAVCPNCGYRDIDLKGIPDVLGDRLLMLKSTFHFRQPRRWEVVAFRHPERAREVAVKRVVGLPGELIQIRDGEIYINGKIARKSLAEQRALAVMLHDANFIPSDKSETGSRWRGVEPETRWRSHQGRFQHPAKNDSDSVDWLVYHHERRLPTSSKRQTPVLNTRGYNQTRPMRSENTHPVVDLMLSFRWVRTIGQGTLLIRVHDGREEIFVHLDPNEKRYESFRGKESFGTQGVGSMPRFGAGLDVGFSIIDRQLVLALNGQEVLVRPYQPLTESSNPTATPLSVGVQTLGVEIEDLKVFRDVYYTRPVGTQGRWGIESPYQLGADEYFVLGDNSLVSSDSRIWPKGPVVKQNVFLGKPFLIHYPSRRIIWKGLEFQVPDLAEIRYIH